MELVTLVYDHTRSFPRGEIYGLTNQLRRAAISVPSNIAEGQGRRSTKEFLNRLSMARGSLMEVRTQAEIARRLAFFAPAQHAEIRECTETVGRLLNGLIRALERKL
ncbi:MAG TPA: four helix bundle protein, partial [Candidatus Hydrogenedentes bacterium]|nr:four helix bundle protein [Candidatus Hydrogenedentota bacterium]